MKFRRQRKDEVTVNLTPLIDVVFLLLIFFMVSTSFKKENHLQLDLPEAGATNAAVASNIIEISVSAAGDYAINNRALVNGQARTLQKALMEVTEGDIERPLVISADATAPHQAVVQVMDVAGRLGFAKLNITTRSSAE